MPTGLHGEKREEQGGATQPAGREAEIARELGR
jgi:hypothetical protein